MRLSSGTGSCWPRRLNRRWIGCGLIGLGGWLLFGLCASAIADELVSGGDPIPQLRSVSVASRPEAGVDTTINKISLTEINSALSGPTAGPTGEVDAGDNPVAALRHYVDRVASALPVAPTGDNADGATGRIANSEFGNDSYARLRAFVGGIDRSQSSQSRLKLADSDNALDALREFLNRHNNSAPPDQPRTPPPTRPRVPLADLPVIPSNPVGSKVCLGCHGGVADTFSHTLMGRLQTQGRMQCETCHGPGSAHVEAAGCASCHGDGGITTRAGFPSLAGQSPQYLVAAIKEYVSGTRRHALMRALLAGLSGAELDSIGSYYARQTPQRAQTPPIGDAASGRAAAGLCAGCHGDQGIAISAAWPNLAGQDAQALANALRAYKDGSRTKTIACAACHGERGISKTPGMPSLVGLSAQYLVTAMKEYATGQRKNAVMKALLAGVSDSELNGIAAYYAQQTPARAQTPLVGDPSAGKAAAAVCLGCHVAEGASPNVAWPGMGGQDARYLAVATAAYKNGSRSDATMKSLVESLDERSIENIASYYATLSPTQPAGAAQGGTKREPVLVRNNLVASLDGRTIDEIATYYASLQPVQVAAAKSAPERPVPRIVLAAAPPYGLSPGGIISFRNDDPGKTVEQNNSVCLGCHQRGQRTYWQGSVHEERGVACTNCHTVMKQVSARAQLRTAFEPDTCFQCHKDRRAQMFRSAHMPTREGKIVCSDCHNPHGSAYQGSSEAMLWTDSINDTCYKCHAEKRGPFLFEHMPVRENCLNCHDAHGTINQYMLKIARPRLCFECHGTGHGNAQGVNGFSFGASMAQSCQNCHIQVHGSNSPAGAALQR